jgi:hypothetical protein
MAEMNQMKTREGRSAPKKASEPVEAAVANDVGSVKIDRRALMNMGLLAA